MLDERTMRAGERAAAARRRAFEADTAAPMQAQPLGVVPVIVLCVVGAVADTYTIVAFGFGMGYELTSLGLVGLALVAVYGLASDRSWAWTVTWMYLALHVFVDLITADLFGPVGFGAAIIYALALMYATTRRAEEVIERGGAL